MKIHLIDEIPGSGKSTWMMEQMLEWHREGKFDQFVYISPFLSEVGGGEDGEGYKNGRIQTVCPEMDFKYPVPKKGSKLVDIKELLTGCENISTTHNLFSSFDRPSIELIGQNKSVLVIDEEVDAYEKFTGISPTSIRHKLKNGELILDKETNRLSWNHTDYPIAGTKYEFSALVKHCDNGCAYLFGASIIIWEFPVEVLKAFNEVWVMTYMFDASVMAKWCLINDIEVVRHTPELYRPTAQVKAELVKNIVLLEPPSIVGIEKFAFSQTWWSNVGDKNLNAVKRFMESLRRTSISGNGLGVSDILITCPKNRWELEDPESTKELIKGHGYQKATWVASNCRATNKYADKRVLIYLLNKYPTPHIKEFCAERGHRIDDDAYALSQMIQMIFRGCVRKGQTMYLVVPNKRMRDLYKQWASEV